MEPETRPKLLSLPNLLSLSRLASIPIIWICLVFPGRLGSFLAALFFGMGFVTDFLDGYYARKRDAVTALGKFLDPLADKLLVSVTMIVLITLNRIPAWMAILIIAREMAITGLRGIAVTEGVVIQAQKLGKYKTVFQAIALVLLCLHYPYFSIDLHRIGIYVLWIALALTLWSGWDYFRQFNHLFFPKKE